MRRTYSYAVLGMLAGSSLGGAVGLMLALTTGNWVLLALGALGPAIGLSLGAALDRKQPR